jgi:hypothetical protein
MENAQPVTKSELQTILQAALSAQSKDIHAAISAQSKEIRAEMSTQRETLRDELMEFSRQIETNMLSAFHGYAKGQQARFHTIEITEADFKLRLAAVEERILALETRPFQSN